MSLLNDVNALLNDVNALSSILRNVVPLIGAIVGAYAYFRLGRRWLSELECSHYELLDHSVIFTAYYTLRNTGVRELKVKEVTICLTASKKEVEGKYVLLKADKNQEYGLRSLRRCDNNPDHKGLFDIRPGERSIFPLRIPLDRLEDTMFVLCECKLETGPPDPAKYRGFYVKYPGGQERPQQQPPP